MTDYTELVKALRCANRYKNFTKECYSPNPNEQCRYYLQFACDDGRLLSDAAAAIEELKAQLPKRGEWIEEDLDNFRKYKVTCPHCGAWFVGNYDAYVEPWDFNYCPHCGNICNPTNIEYENELKEREKEARAKMEVQE